MLELLISRTALAVIGVVIIGLSIGAVANLDTAQSSSMAQELAGRLAAKISEIASIDGSMLFILSMDDYLPAFDWSIEITSGTVTVVHASSRGTAAITCDLAVAGASGRLTAYSDDLVVIERTAGGDRPASIHVEKVEEIPLTASTNFSQSCMSL